jgi:hypothetical protein
MSSIRKDAPRLPRPAARYWKGKAPKGAAEAGSDSEDEATPTPLEEGDIPIQDHQDAGEDEEEEDGIQLRRDVAKSKSISVALKDVSVSKEGKVIIAGREESGRTLVEAEGMPYYYCFCFSVEPARRFLSSFVKNSRKKNLTKSKLSLEKSPWKVQQRRFVDSVYAALYLDLSALVSQANTSLTPRKKRSQNSNLGPSLFPSALCFSTH